MKSSMGTGFVMNDLHPAELEMIEAGGRTAHTFGLNRLLGQIYMLLYMNPDPLSLDDIMEKLGVSKASVSIACRQLQSWGAVHDVWKQGDRRHYYRAETDFGHILENGILSSIEKKLNSAKVQIDISRALLEESGHEGADCEFLRKRLDQADTYRTRIEGVVSNKLVRQMVRKTSRA